MSDTQLKAITKRLERLEKAILHSQKERGIIKKGGPFTGPSGGVLLLVSKDFFESEEEAWRCARRACKAWLSLRSGSSANCAQQALRQEGAVI